MYTAYPLDWHFVPEDQSVLVHGVDDASLEDVVAALQAMAQDPRWVATRKVVLDFRLLRSLHTEADVKQLINQLRLYDFLAGRAAAVVVYPGQQTGIARMVLLQVGILADVKVFHQWRPALVSLQLAPE